MYSGLFVTKGGIKLRKSSSPVGCRFFGRSGEGIEVRTTGAFGITSLGFCGAMVGHRLRGRCGCEF